MSTTLIEINQMMLNNLRDVNHEIKNIILSKLPNDLHSIVLQSFNQSKRLEALNSVRTITDILRVLKNDLVWIPPVLHCLDEDGKDIEDPCEEGEDFYYVPIVETLKSILNDDSFRKSSSLGNDVFIVNF